MACLPVPLTRGLPFPLFPFGVLIYPRLELEWTVVSHSMLHPNLRQILRVHVTLLEGDHKIFIYLLGSWNSGAINIAMSWSGRWHTETWGCAVFERLTHFMAQLLLWLLHCCNFIRKLFPRMKNNVWSRDNYQWCKYEEHFCFAFKMFQFLNVRVESNMIWSLLSMSLD